MVVNALVGLLLLCLFSYSVGSLTLLVRVQNIFKQVLQEAGLLKQAWYCYTELHCDFSMKIVPY